MKLHRYTVTLALKDIAGGYPGHIDAMRQFLQNPAMAKRVPAAAREEFLGQERTWSATATAATEDGENEATVEGALDIVKTGFRLDPEGRPFIGNYQIKAMLQQAGKAMYDNVSRPSIYQIARAI